jgi:chemotaxis protein MotC
MSRCRLTAAACAAILSFMPQAWAGDVLQLQKSVRTLESLQDAVANGDVEASRLQARLIAQIETDIRLSPDEVLKNPRNLHALATVLFSGGSPNIVEAHSVSLEMDVTTRNLISGALAYARADRAGALHYLEKINIAELPPNLGGRVALVRSVIGASDNPQRAIDDLYLARQLMPGTLVEEASLRRCVAFAGKINDLTRLEFCASRYIRRFSRSLYWAEFAANYAMAVAQTGFGEDKTNKAMLASFERLGTAKRRTLLLMAARAALTHGRHQLAKQLAENAIPLCRAESVEMKQAKLFLAAAEIATRSYHESRDRLDSLDMQGLEAADVKLLAQARNLADEIERPPALSQDEVVRLAASQLQGDGQQDSTRVVEAARALLDKTSKITRQAAP